MIKINILKRIETDYKHTPAQIMEKLNISKSAYSMVKNDKLPVSKKLALRINSEYKYPLEDILLRPEVQEKETPITPTGTDS